MEKEKSITKESEMEKQQNINETMEQQKKKKKKKKEEKKMNTIFNEANFINLTNKLQMLEEKLNEITNTQRKQQQDHFDNSVVVTPSTKIDKNGMDKNNGNEVLYENEYYQMIILLLLIVIIIRKIIILTVIIIIVVVVIAIIAHTIN